MTSFLNGATIVHNGFTPSVDVQADFYAKLARLENEVLTGRHPKYQLPKPAVEKLASALVNTVPVPSFQGAKKIVTNGSHPQLPSQQQSPTPPTPAVNPLPPRPSVIQEPYIPKQISYSRPAVSQIDPVLLTKSDDLVRAETRLKRQRIERALKDSVEHRKRSFKNEHKNDLDALSGPLSLDSVQVLEIARSAVKPVSGLKESVTNSPHSSGASSFGGEYYSSKGNSWTPEQRAAAALADAAKVHEGDAAVSSTLVRAGEGIAQTLQKDRVSGLGPKKPPVVIKRAVELSTSDLQHADISDLARNAGEIVSKGTEILRDESYSPPAASAFVANIGHPILSNLHIDHQHETLSDEAISDDNGSDADRSRESASYSPPPAAFPLIQNRINYPYASQSAYVAPSNRNGQQQAFSSGRRPNTSSARLEKRQRRKEERKEAREARKVRPACAATKNNHHTSTAAHTPRQTFKRKREEEVTAPSPRVEDSYRPIEAVRSSEPYIKPEPISPPLPQRHLNRATVGAPRRLVVRSNGQTDIEELDSRRATPDRSAPHRLRQAAPQPVYAGPRCVDPEVIWIDSPEGPPPAVRRRIDYDPTNARRVASLQYPTRPQSAARQPLPYPADEVRYVRGSSRLVEQQLSRQPDMFEGEIVEVAPRYARSRYGSVAPQFDGYASSTPLLTRQMMPPPPLPMAPSKRRTFIDENGNEFMIVPVGSVTKQSVAPESHYLDEASPYERDTYQQVPRRAQSQFLDRAPLLQAPPSRAQSRLMQRQPMPRQQQQQQYIEFDEDEEDSYESMLPPPPRIKNRIVRPTDDLVYQQEPLRLRATSIQPAQQPREQLREQLPPRYVSGARWAVEEGVPQVRQRAYRVRSTQQQQQEPPQRLLYQGSQETSDQEYEPVRAPQYRRY